MIRYRYSYFICLFGFVLLSKQRHGFEVSAAAISNITGTTVCRKEWKELGSFDAYRNDQDIVNQFGSIIAASSVGMTANGATIVLSDEQRSIAQVWTYQAIPQGANSTSKKWKQIGPNIRYDREPSLFGVTLAISGDGTTIVIGYPVRVYQKVRNANTGLASYVFMAALDEYVSSVALSHDGKTIAVGSSAYNARSGRVRVYQKQHGITSNTTASTYFPIGDFYGGESTTVESATGLPIIIADFVGTAVRLSADGTTLAITAMNKGRIESDPNRAGRVRVYKRVAPGAATGGNVTWTQMGHDIVAESIFDYFHYSLDLSADGTQIVIGVAYFGYCFYTDCSDELFVDRGTENVRVYQFNTPLKGSWNQVGSKISMGFEDRFGTTVAISANGKRIAVGAPGAHENDSSQDPVGVVRVFELSPNREWEQLGNNIWGIYFPRNFVSSSVAMSADGNTVVVGDNVNVYKLNADCSTNDTRAPTKSPVANTKSPIAITKSPTKSPIANCDITYNLYNSQTDTLVTPIYRNSVITNPPPCNRTNIEVVVPCGIEPKYANKGVLIELRALNVPTYNRTQLVHSSTEKYGKYFLFGDNTTTNNIFNGRIVPGKYNIRGLVNGKYSPAIPFTIGGTTCQ